MRYSILISFEGCIHTSSARGLYFTSWFISYLPNCQQSKFIPLFDKRIFHVYRRSTYNHKTTECVSPHLFLCFSVQRDEHRVQDDPGGQNDQARPAAHCRLLPQWLRQAAAGLRLRGRPCLLQVEAPAWLPNHQSRRGSQWPYPNSGRPGLWGDQRPHRWYPRAAAAMLADHVGEQKLLSIVTTSTVTVPWDFFILCLLVCKDF